MELVHTVDLAPAIAALCGSTDLLGGGGIALALLGTGLVGSFAHCAPMCGPFVLMQVTEPDGGGLALRKLAAAALPGYQLGRMTTYVALGVVMGAVGGSITALSGWHWLLAGLLALAAASFLLQALKSAIPGLAGSGVSGLGTRLAVPLARLIGANTRLALKGYPLGLVLGLLPCGFLYAALIAAAASGGAIAGGAAMAGFALGTMPALITVGVLGTGAALRWRRLARRLATPIFLFNALTLASLAVRALA